MDEKVDALRVPNEILRHPRVPRQHDGPTTVIDPVAECGPRGRMIDLERRDF
jgi:hypothetical protein